MGKAFKKVGKILGKIEKFDPIAGPVNKMLGVENSLQPAEGLLNNFTGKTAIEAARMQAEQVEASSRQAAILQQNSAALQGQNVLDNTNTVVAGGTAASTDTNDLTRRRRGAGSLSAVIGI